MSAEKEYDYQPAGLEFLYKMLAILLIFGISAGGIYYLSTHWGPLDHVIDLALELAKDKYHLFAMSGRTARLMLSGLAGLVSLGIFGQYVNRIFERH